MQETRTENGRRARVKRAQGSLVGLLAGDALGSMVEFSYAEDLRKRYPRGLRVIGPSPVWRTRTGQPTDDGEMALTLSRALINQSSYDADLVGQRYVRWMQSHPFDMGGTTAAGLRALSVRSHQTGLGWRPNAWAAGTQSSQANGGLMRIGPLGIWAHPLSDDEIHDAACADARLTHPSIVCQHANSVLVYTIAQIVRRGLDEYAAYGAAVDYANRMDLVDPVRLWLDQAESTRPVFRPNIGHVKIALHNAFYQLLHAPSFEEALVRTVMGGGDTDTNGAVCGALLGAVHGIGGIPVQWRNAVITCRSQPGAGRPRPRWLWPCDALSLAAQLVDGVAGGVTIGEDEDTATAP